MPHRLFDLAAGGGSATTPERGYSRARLRQPPSASSMLPRGRTPARRFRGIRSIEIFEEFADRCVPVPAGSCPARRQPGRGRPAARTSAGPARAIGPDHSDVILVELQPHQGESAPPPAPPRVDRIGEVAGHVTVWMASTRCWRQSFRRAGRLGAGSRRLVRSAPARGTPAGGNAGQCIQRVRSEALAEDSASRTVARTPPPARGR